jgi:alpha/beta superfamily hydrolase
MMTGEQLRDQGQARALTAAEEWAEAARACIEWLADQGQPFTSEDVVALIGLPDPSATGSNRNNAVGAVIAGAARRGVIRRVGYRNANRELLHAAVVAEWVRA